MPITTCGRPPAESTAMRSPPRSARTSTVADCWARSSRVWPSASRARMLAELSMTSTIRRCRFFCQLQSGSVSAVTTSSTNANCKSNDNRCRSRCHQARGFFSSNSWSQNNRVETGCRRSRILRRYSSRMGTASASHHQPLGLANSKRFIGEAVPSDGCPRRVGRLTVPGAAGRIDRPACSQLRHPLRYVVTPAVRIIRRISSSNGTSVVVRVQLSEYIRQ